MSFHLDRHYAVVCKPTDYANAQKQKMILTEKCYEHLKAMVADGHFVIIEAWEITKGKCVSN
jgi:UDP-N-acetyl-D-mannosaminuronate dehydrogenase